MGDRVILHSDINCCYASIEHLHHPELAGKPLAVGGDPEARHGIVLTADYIAKKYGVKTGMALWQAKQVCPDITFVSPRMDLYLRFSRMAHEIYAEYTDRQEPYGIDECWLDVTGSSSLKGDGLLIAQEISRRMKSELGITVSVGVSFNKKISIELKEGIFMAVTNNIREIREQRGIYQDDLAAAIGYSTKTVGRIERGDSTPSAEFMLRISKYFNMLVEDVFHVED